MRPILQHWRTGSHRVRLAPTSLPLRAQLQHGLGSTARAGWRHAILLFALLLSAACSEQAVVAPADPDSALQARVTAALADQPDLPPGLDVLARDGHVIISGALACDACGGNSTPGTAGTVQQSIGAVVRAVPGVSSVEFQFTNEQ